MKIKRFICVLVGLMVVGSACFAQGAIERPGQKLGNRSGVVGLEKLDALVDAKSSLPSGYKGYTDDSLEKMAERMREQDWAHEDTAWERASSMNSTQGYERYLGIFPYGAHAAEASVRLIGTKVNDALANAHSDLPAIKHIEEDEDSPTTTVIVENNTGYPLSVYWAGTENKSVVIAPDRKASITIKSGRYKLAADVPPNHIHPFAGQTSFTGGVYEIGFWVVTY